MNRHLQSVLALLVFGVLLTGLGPLSGCTQEEDASLQSQESETQAALSDTALEVDVPYVDTRQEVVERMLEMAEVSEDDVVYDLGSGDGRIVITAAEQFGARGVGVEIDSGRVEEARENAQEAGVSDRVEFRHGDMYEADFSDATVVTLYLLPTANLKLRPELFSQLDPGDRVVSHDFDMGEWKPDRTEEVGRADLYLWTIPSQRPSSLE